MEHKPTGCNIVHPFTLRPDVEWGEEGSAFSILKWEYIDSQVKHTELRRFQYANLVCIVIPLQLMFACLVYPFVFFTLEDVPYLWAFFLVGLVYVVVIPLALFAHVKRSWQHSWTKVKIALDILLLVNCLIADGYWHLVQYWIDCSMQDSDDISIMLGRSMSNTTGYGWTPERQNIYCRQIIYPFAFFSLVFIPLTVNVPTYAVGGYLFLRALQEIGNRPILVAMGLYSTPDPAGRLISFLLVLTFGCAVGMLLYVKQQGSSKAAFVQAVTLATEIQQAKAKGEHVDLLLSATVPPSVLIRLSKNEIVSDYTPSATVLFSDMVSFTFWSSSRPPQQVVTMLNYVTELIDKEAVRLQVEKIKTIGDAYWAVTGLPEEMENHAHTMCQFGGEMLRVIAESSAKHPEWGSVQFRVGIHTGPLYGGILGTTMISYEVFGETSDVASKVEQNGLPSRVCMTQEAALEAGIEPAQMESCTKAFDHNGTHYPLVAVIGSEHVQSVSGEKSRSPSLSSEVSEKPAETASSNASCNDAAGRERRKAFLQQRAMAQARKAEAEMEYIVGSTDEFDLRLRYTKLKWSWLLSTFADPDAESDFGLFALQQQRELRLLSRGILMGVPILLLLGSAIEQSTPNTPPISTGMIICLLLALLNGGGDALLLYWTSYRNPGSEWPVVQVLLSFITSILITLAAAFANPGCSVMTNDPSWLGHALTLLTMLGNYGVIQTLWLMLVYLFVTWPLMFVATYRSYNYGTHRTMEGQLFLTAGFLLSLYERQLRQQFKDLKLQTYFQREQLHRVAEQDALLKSIVPEHISGALLTWMSGDMKLPLVRNYSTCAVSFMYLLPPTPEPTPPQQSEKQHHDQGAGVKVNENPLLSTGSEQDGEDADEEEQGTKFTQRPDDPEGGGLETLFLEGAGGRVAQQQEENPHYSWHAAAITQVDELLSTKKNVCKIKTIGDIVMLAGPFAKESQAVTGSQPEAEFQPLRNIVTDPDELKQAVVELVDLSQEVQSVGGGANCGIHCGELVGAIQGTSRLCFDVFGDTVNVASRCMSGVTKIRKATATTQSASRTDVCCAVSPEVKNIVDGADAKGGAEKITFEEASVTAKGKGMMTVYLVTKILI